MPEPETQPVDVWRESLLRYAGYANEVGEAFRHVVPRMLVPSYAVALLYVSGDTLDKTMRSYREGRRASVVAYTSFDVFMWQLLASVAIPGFTIHQVVKYAGKAVTHPSAKMPAAVVAWAPTLLGLGAVPLIIHPIDHAVDFAMDNTVRVAAGTVGLTRPAALLVHATAPVAAPAVPAGALPTARLDATTLVASAKVVSQQCASANAAFLQCKREYQDPERCLSFGSDVLTCGLRVADSIAHSVPEPFAKYHRCLTVNGNELKKCYQEEAAFLAAWESSREALRK
jgi:fission process protein 1